MALMNQLIMWNRTLFQVASKLLKILTSSQATTKCIWLCLCRKMWNLVLCSEIPKRDFYMLNTLTALILRPAQTSDCNSSLSTTGWYSKGRNEQGLENNWYILFSLNIHPTPKSPCNSRCTNLTCGENLAEFVIQPFKLMFLSALGSELAFLHAQGTKCLSRHSFMESGCTLFT